MRPLKAFKPQILQFSLLASSLNELLLSLKIICENLDLEKVNCKTRHFREFRLTFFGLMVKANGILDRMLWQAEFLKENNQESAEIFLNLKKLKKSLNNALSLVERNNLRDAAMQILEAAKEYHEEFKQISSLAQVLL
jgi:hypothetical protein